MRLTPLLILVLLLGTLPGLTTVFGRSGAEMDPNGAPAPSEIGIGSLLEVTGRTGAEYDPDGAPPPEIGVGDLLEITGHTGPKINSKGGTPALPETWPISRPAWDSGR